MSEDPVPVAVVGAGNMGANHVRVYDELPEADLVEVVEPDADRAAEVRERYDVRVVADVSDLERSQAASVAVPNEMHRESAEACIRSGLDVLVEKPLAMAVADAEAIVDAAADHGAVLQVGHIEHFNPAVAVLRGILAGEELIALESHRLGPFNEHLSTESVVFDLMIHDLDVVDSLVDADLDTVSAVGTRSRSEKLDYAVGHLRYENGVLGTTTASHVTHDKVRNLHVTAREVFVELDYQNQSLTINRRGVGQTTTIGGQAGYRTEKVSETPFVSTREPLKNELEHFLHCVRTREAPEVDGSRGVRATRLAAAVVECIGPGR